MKLISCLIASDFALQEVVADKRNTVSSGVASAGQGNSEHMVCSRNEAYVLQSSLCENIV